MPQGVEHRSSNRRSDSGGCHVPTSVMPQGVEHLQSAALTATPIHVPTSVMPQGVEHITAETRQHAVE